MYWNFHSFLCFCLLSGRLLAVLFILYRCIVFFKFMDKAVIFDSMLVK